MVPLRGDAPRSAGYRPAALLLSYRGMKKLAEHQRMPCAIAHHLSARRIWHGLGRGNRTLDAFAGRSGFRNRFLVYAGRAPLKWRPHLEPRPLEAAYAYSITPCGLEAGSSGWIRTNTAALTERHPTVRSPRNEMVEPDGNAPSLAGCKPAVLSSTLRSHENWTQGMELHQPRQAYETRQSTGSPCILKMNENAHEEHGDRHGGPVAAFEVAAVRPVCRGHQ